MNNVRLLRAHQFLNASVSAPYRSLSTRGSFVSSSSSASQAKIRDFRWDCSDESTKNSMFRANGDATISAEEAAELLKKRQQTQSAQPRPIFPWRHEPLDNPLPRLDPASTLFRPFLGLRLQQLISYWFLRVPAWQVLLSYGSWRQELADYSGYAFQQAVWGILTNVYKLEASASSAASGKIQFNVKEESAKEPNGTNVENTPDDTSVSNSSSVTSSSPTGDAERHHPAFSSKQPSDEIPEVLSRTQKDDSSSEDAAKDEKNAPAKAEPLEAVEPQEKGETPNISQSSSSPTKTDETVHAKTVSEDAAETTTNTAKLDLSEMLIRPLKRLFESAHESGRDQLLIRLQMEPISAHLLSIACIPYVSREEASSDPEKIKKLRSLRFLSAREGYQTVMQTLEGDLQRHGKLETTVEIQVLVVCREIFQVQDRVTGQVLQGSPDASEQEVGHVVRLETTSVQELNIDNGSFFFYQTNWQITDIDDLVSPVAWYEK